MIPRRSIAAAQTTPIRGDVEANLDQHTRLTEAAARLGAEMLVFPELSLTGYELDLAEDLAFSESDRRLTQLSELASTHQMILVVGAPVRIGSRLHIGAFILSENGIQVYTKHHLGAFQPRGSLHVPPAESTVFHPGTRNPLIRFAGTSAAVAVCADASRPSHPEAAAGRGATAYLASMFVIPADLEKECGRLRSYARKHSLAVVLANYGGASGGLPSAGSSAIWTQQGKLLGQLPETGAGILVASEADAIWRTSTLIG